MPMTKPTTEQAINTIRTLSMDAVQKANSGHPGTPMALAPMTYTLYKKYMRFDPQNPDWPDRDRFVLSNGHASMLLYSTLHLAGYDLSLENLQNFRQWGSPTAGHPERGEVPGVEVTTGPLGQGIANAVGMAMAEEMLAARFNRPGHTIVDHHTYVICGDGDLMEGISYEAGSLAGRQKLGKLICLYDDNKISIAGSTDLTFSEDVEARHKSMGWHTCRVDDVNDLEALEAAIDEARSITDRPSMILVRTVIGFGSPSKAGTASAHGEPLGEDEIAATKEAYGWPRDESFRVTAEVRDHFADFIARGQDMHKDWKTRFESYRKEHADLAAEFERVFAGRRPENWATALRSMEVLDKPEASRASSGRAIQIVAGQLPELTGGSADLDPSTKTFIKSSVNFDEGQREGRNVQYGIREHAMGAAANGMLAHGGVRAFCATFFVFCDYLRPTIRLAAISHLPTIFVFTHDSIGLGEDGPTHQPVEHLMSLRAMPKVNVFRPADTRETVEAWEAAIERTDGPSVLVLSRQGLAPIDRSPGGLGKEEGALRGGYVVQECEGTPDVTLIGTGSEVSLALEAARMLESEGKTVRVVSLPCWEVFLEQDPNYQQAVLGPEGLPRVAVEAGAAFGWEKLVGAKGAIVGLDRFGASAPGKTVMEKLGITAERVAAAARELV